MDILTELWRSLDEAGRERLAAELLSGPPDAMLAHIEDAERQTSRDRRVYDRIAVLEGLEHPPLTTALAEHVAALREAYPHWRPSTGERAHFSTWMEVRWGPDARLSSDDLALMKDRELIETLRTDQDRREGLLDSWRQLATAQPERVTAILKQIADSGDPGPADIWESGWYGLRNAEGEHAVATTDQMVTLLSSVPGQLFRTVDVVRCAADILEAKSKGLGEGPEPGNFWLLFDRTLAAVREEPAVQPMADRGTEADWVTDAINHPLGVITTAIINILFARRPKVGSGIPVALKSRLDALMNPDDSRHRLARVIGASRISYLYAVDPEWTRINLIPSFSWRDEEESIAIWQAYAWQARMDPQLWAALKPHFLSLFTSQRLARIGHWGRSIAQSLMLVGVAFGPDELKRDEVREAIRAMPEPMRAEAAAWIASYMNVDDEAEQRNDQGEPLEDAPDVRWNDRVWPWLKRVWPTEKALRSTDVSEQFAMAAIATRHAFPDAVNAVRTFAMLTTSFQIAAALNESDHPTDHPAATLALIDAFIAKDPIILMADEAIRSIVKRIGAADPRMLQDNRYRLWLEFCEIRSAH